MANYAIMRWGKIKYEGVAGAEHHQKTELHTNCEHPELRANNFTVKQFEDETLRKTVKRCMMHQQEQTGRKVRKDATVLVDFVFTFSPEMAGSIDMQKWIDANIKWLQQEFGKNNLLRFDMHWHESTPHLHAFVVPLDENGRFNFKKHTKHISQLVALQDRYAEAMKPFGLERGVSRYTPHRETDEIVRHRPLTAWRKELLDEIKDFEQKVKVNAELDDSIGDKLLELHQLQLDIESRKGTHKKFKQRFFELKQHCERLQSEKATLESELSDLQRDMETEKRKFAALKDQAADLARQIAHRKKHLFDEIWGADTVGSKSPSHEKGRLTAGDDVLGDWDR